MDDGSDTCDGCELWIRSGTCGFAAGSGGGDQRQCYRGRWSGTNAQQTGMATLESARGAGGSASRHFHPGVDLCWTVATKPGSRPETRSGVQHGKPGDDETRPGFVVLSGSEGQAVLC